MERERYLLVGQVVKPHGISGEVGVRSLTEWPELRFKPLSRLYLGPDDTDLRTVVLNTVRPFKQGYLLTFENISDREAAEKIRGWNLYISEDQAAAPEEGHYYQHQLIGLAVVDEQGAELGRVQALEELGAYALLLVGGRGGRSFHLPLVEAFVLAVVLEEGKLVVRLPEGLTDL